jgi:hypothetical protein
VLDPALATASVACPWTAELRTELMRRFTDMGPHDLATDLHDRYPTRWKEAGQLHGTVKAAVKLFARRNGLLHLGPERRVEHDDWWEWARVSPREQALLEDLARGVRDGEDAQGWPLYLYGPVGTGKTGAARAFLNRVRFDDGDPNMAYKTPPDLLRQCMDGAESSLWAKVASMPIAVLDELGTREKMNDFHYEKVLAFAEKRENLPAIYISNLSPLGPKSTAGDPDASHSELYGLYGKRIYDRLCRGTVYELNGVSQRTGL